MRVIKSWRVIVVFMAFSFLSARLVPAGCQGVIVYHWIQYIPEDIRCQGGGVTFFTFFLSLRTKRNKMGGNKMGGKMNNYEEDEQPSWIEFTDKYGIEAMAWIADNFGGSRKYIPTLGNRRR